MEIVPRAAPCRNVPVTSTLCGSSIHLLLTRIGDREAVAGAHREFFRDIRPVNTIMQVSRFIDPDWLVEIEADAVVDDDGAAGTFIQADAALRHGSIEASGSHDDNGDRVEPG